MRAIISLTSIPPRFSYLSETLNSLVNQTADIEDIILYIPRKYKRFEYDLDDLCKDMLISDLKLYGMTFDEAKDIAKNITKK